MSEELSETGRSTAIGPVSPRQAVGIAGLAYALIIVLGAFSTFFVFGRVIEQDDAAAAAGTLVGSDALFRGGLAAFVVVLIADVVVAWALFVFFQRTSRELSLLVAWFRLLYVAIAGAALLDLVIASSLANGPGYATALAAGQRDAQVKVFVDAFNYGWRIGLVFFGLHLLLLGLVIVSSDYAPSLLGRLVSLAGLAYVASNLAIVLLANQHGSARLVTLALVVLGVPGEFGLVGWLLWRARPAPRRAPR